ncbi:nitrogenase component 1 [Candidatus Desulforudis audaxviator]|uniref:Nitrogenase n=1 Tax=Desulforudis audaxviator (strain MP104C) TaxID=477974 RepID=B1I0Z3_DESAP|nr:nitrogenase component 1 [Candidatus Desulforudis audaxviator]ACA58716.1 Nitrogenase [Candidatus Desulforudis audaxviator MP104C]AZK58719.1 Nitrogenase (molybdenum-iron) alpha chain [Candidatus Desulforudis audaxviator]
MHQPKCARRSNTAEQVPFIDAGRADHGVIVKPEPRLPACDRQTVPGAMSQRSCAYYGARWFLAQLKQVLHLVHGPVSCAYYGETVRKKRYTVFSTDLTENEVIFGGEAKLLRVLRELAVHFPENRAILVYVTCAPGIIGDDVDRVCRRAERDTGMRCVPVHCPGFLGYHQAAGHEAGARVFLEHFIGHDAPAEPGPRDINLLGEFDVMGDYRVIRGMLRRMGVNVVNAVTADASVESLARAHRVQLNLIHCRRTGGLLAEEMESRYGIEYRKGSFFGLTETSTTLRRLGDWLDCRAEAEALIAEGEAMVAGDLERYRRELAGKRVGLFFGGSRIGSMLKGYRDLGLEVVAAGSQFGCGNDYREAWTGLNPGAALVDDTNEEEFVQFIRQYRPDVIAGGTREKWLAHKFGIPFTVFPQESGPYAGYSGFLNFARDILAALKAPVWRIVRGGSNTHAPFTA